MPLPPAVKGGYSKQELRACRHVDEGRLATQVTLVWIDIDGDRIVGTRPRAAPSPATSVARPARGESIADRQSPYHAAFIRRTGGRDHAGRRRGPHRTRWPRNTWERTRYRMDHRPRQAPRVALHRSRSHPRDGRLGVGRGHRKRPIRRTPRPATASSPERLAELLDDMLSPAARPNAGRFCGNCYHPLSAQRRSCQYCGSAVAAVSNG